MSRRIKSVLKEQKIKMILSYIRDTSGKKCLDIGSGSGIISLMLRGNGGDWASGEMEEHALNSIRKVVGEDVYRIDGQSTPFRDKSFDVVVIVDFLEHIETDKKFVSELYRIVKDGGILIINVPLLRRGAPIPILRNLIGLTDEKHGHIRPGYTLPGLRDLLGEKFEIVRHSTYVKFFSELIDTAINFLGKGEKRMEVSEEGPMFRLYSVIYPFLCLISKLDCLLFFAAGARLIIKARKRSCVSGLASL